MRRWSVVTCAAALVVLATPAGAVADGTETLGPPGITVASGSGALVAGVGMQRFPNTPRDFSFTVPAGATVKQVLLYWEGHWSNHPPNASNIPQVDGDNVVSVNGVPVVGTKIGGSTAFFSQNAGPFGATEMFVTYRADITGLGAVSAGPNTLTVSDMLFASNFPDGTPFNQGNDGAGVLVIYDAGGTAATIGVRDGLDLAFAGFAAPLDATVAQTFTFPASTVARTANLATLAGGVSGPDLEGPRANQLAISFSPVGDPIVINNPWQSSGGFEFDALNSSVTVPAGATSMTVRAISGGPQGHPASFAWNIAALSIPNPAKARLGDLVWDDRDRNGIQDTGEPGVAGVTVKLYDCAGRLVGTRTTDGNGNYLFDDLDSGGYQVEFVLPNGYVFSPADQGSEDARDSDPNTSTGMTRCYTLAEGETNLTVDAGVNRLPTPPGPCEPGGPTTMPDGRPCVQPVTPASLNAPQQPAGGVAPAVAQRVAARARMNRQSRCVSRPFRQVISGQGIRRVTVSVNGRRVDRLQGSRTRYTIRIDPRDYATGVMRVAARVEYVAASGKRAQTLRTTVQRCALRRAAPQRVRFTG